MSREFQTPVASVFYTLMILLIFSFSFLLWWTVIMMMRLPVWPPLEIVALAHLTDFLWKTGKHLPAAPLSSRGRTRRMKGEWAALLTMEISLISMFILFNIGLSSEPLQPYNLIAWLIRSSLFFSLSRESSQSRQIENQVSLLIPCITSQCIS